jgi:Clp amino terminal domain, pathogenicity island component
VFESFTDDARDVIIAAQEEARWLRREKIGTEHLLLGIIRIRPGIAELVPGEPKLLLTAARQAAGVGTVDPPGYIPYTAGAEQAIADASRLAEGAIGRIAPEHLLLALLRQRGETTAQLLLTALQADRAALSSWAGRFLADGTQAVVGAERDGTHGPVGDTIRGPVGDGQRRYPAAAPSRRPGLFLAIFGPWEWGSRMEGVRTRHRAWFLAACAVSLGYAAWAIVAYQGSQLFGAGRERWAIAIIIVLTLCSGALIYFSGKGFRSLAEGWRISGPVKGFVIALGYAAAGLLPLAIAAGIAIGASILAFGSSSVLSLFTHPGSVNITAQLACLLLVPVVLAAAAFVAYAPFWHYSWTPCGLCKTASNRSFKLVFRRFRADSQHAPPNTGQRLPLPIERRFSHHTFRTRGSRCVTSVCQGWTKSNSTNLNTAWLNYSTSHGIKGKGVRVN